MWVSDREGMLNSIREAIADWSDEEIEQLGALFSQDLSQSANPSDVKDKQDSESGD